MCSDSPAIRDRQIATVPALVQVHKGYMEDVYCSNGHGHSIPKPRTTEMAAGERKAAHSHEDTGAVCITTEKSGSVYEHDEVSIIISEPQSKLQKETQSSPLYTELH